MTPPLQTGSQMARSGPGLLSAPPHTHSYEVIALLWHFCLLPLLLLKYILVSSGL